MGIDVFVLDNCNLPEDISDKYDDGFDILAKKLYVDFGDSVRFYEAQNVDIISDDPDEVKKELEENMMVCPLCEYHFRINAKTRISQLFDEGAFEELNKNIKPTDPLEFVDTVSYKERLELAHKKTNLDEFENKEYNEMKVMINPVIISKVGLTRYWEACASCLDNIGLVERPYKIEVKY